MNAYLNELAKAEKIARDREKWRTTHVARALYLSREYEDERVRKGVKQ